MLPLFVADSLNIAEEKFPDWFKEEQARVPESPDGCPTVTSTVSIDVGVPTGV